MSSVAENTDKIEINPTYEAGNRELGERAIRGISIYRGLNNWGEAIR